MLCSLCVSAVKTICIQLFTTDIYIFTHALQEILLVFKSVDRTSPTSKNKIMREGL